MFKCTTNLTETDHHVVLGLNLAGSLLSVLGSTLTIVFFFMSMNRSSSVDAHKSPTYQRKSTSNNNNNNPNSSRRNTIRWYVHRCIVCLSFADLITSVTVAVSVLLLVASSNMEYSKNTCVVIRMILQTSFVSTFFWTGIIAVYLVQEVYGIRVRRFQFIFCNIISWGIPLLFTLYLLFKHDYVKTAQGWCTVKNPAHFEFWYLPLTALFAWNLVAYIAIIIKFRSVFINIIGASGRTQQLQTKMYKRLSLYVLTFLLCWVWDMIDAILVQFFPTCGYVPFIEYMQVFFTPSQGFFNFLVYTITNGIVYKATAPSVKKSTVVVDDEQKYLLYDRVIQSDI
eukprot:TRINITY_DN4013_c0_g1_i1.p1 TRINITY_DN4013_c0_g1~~TRINITY_DN4013_c0_g1_i1.p1  ORF type:complete len:340 (-),score=48.69 TRINITY_DN4013_c0_g1_i1:33-1052(-)